MARSVLNALVSGTRQMLTAQLFISVGAVALAGWTLAITNDLVRERDRLRDRVIQLEQAMAGGGIVVPATPVVVDQAPPPADATAYPGSVGLTGNAPGQGQTAVEVTADAPNTAATPAPAPTATRPDFTRVLTGIFAPPPPLHVVVLHVRDQADAQAARQIAADLIRSARVRVMLDVMPARDPRLSGYAYFDGRQSSAAATLVGQFNDIARRYEIATWSAQLRGTALPAQGEYTADRVDLVLPPLPPPAPPPVNAPVTELRTITQQVQRVAPQSAPPTP